MKIKLGVSLGSQKREDEIEVPDDEIEGLDQEEREKYLQEVLNDWYPNYVDMWASFVDE